MSLIRALNKTDDLKVFISNRDSTCDECHEQLGRKAWITLAGERGALCLACADLDHRHPTVEVWRDKVTET